MKSSLAVGLALVSCQGEINNAACEGQHFQPIGIPATLGMMIPSGISAPIPAFQAAFGSAIASGPGVNDTRQIDIFLSPMPDSCPTSFEFANAPHDMLFIEVYVEVPTSQLTTFINTAMTINMVTTNVYIGHLSPGSSEQTSATNDVATAGQVTITKFTDGQEVAGQFDVTLQDGVLVTGAFDVPFCTAQCGNSL